MSSPSRHTVVKHGDHYGFLSNGELLCRVEGELNVRHSLVPMSRILSHGTLVSVLCSPLSSPMAMGTTTGSSMETRGQGEEEKGKCDGHVHGPECGHEAVMHGDHLDYLVDGLLHYAHDGHCDLHGDVEVVEENKALLGLQPSDWVMKRRLTAIQDGNNEEIVSVWFEDVEARRFLIMLLVSTAFFILELTYGLISDSLALVTDSLHMLSDIVALIVGFYAVRVTRQKHTQEFTYGWYRMEAVGALVNAIFLMALCFSLVVNALERLADPYASAATLFANSQAIVIVGGVGLIFNMFGMFLFGHGHSHGGDEEHGHSHEHSHVESHEHDHSHEHSHANDHEAHAHSHDNVHDEHDHGNMNIYSIWLHLAGDAAGNIAVILSGLVLMFSTAPQRVYADPLSSLFITLLIFVSSVPLVKRSIELLLQKVPRHVNMEKLRLRLLAVHGVHSIHEFHVWSLNSEKTIGTMHIVMSRNVDFMHASDEVKLVMHSFGIHSTTIQPEYLPDGDFPVNADFCMEPICANKDCAQKSCCANQVVPAEV